MGTKSSKKKMLVGFVIVILLSVAAFFLMKSNGAMPAKEGDVYEKMRNKEGEFWDRYEKNNK